VDRWVTNSTADRRAKCSSHPPGLEGDEPGSDRYFSTMTGEARNVTYPKSGLEHFLIFASTSSHGL